MFHPSIFTIFVDSSRLAGFCIHSNVGTHFQSSLRSKLHLYIHTKGGVELFSKVLSSLDTYNQNNIHLYPEWTASNCRDGHSKGKSSAIVRAIDRIRASSSSLRTGTTAAKTSDQRKSISGRRGEGAGERAAAARTNVEASDGRVRHTTEPTSTVSVSTMYIHCTTSSLASSIDTWELSWCCAGDTFYRSQILIKPKRIGKCTANFRVLYVIRNSNYDWTLNPCRPTVRTTEDKWLIERMWAFYDACCTGVSFKKDRWDWWVHQKTHEKRMHDFTMNGLNPTYSKVKVKVPPRAEAHRAALISVSVALSQRPDKSARPRTRS